jgi:hypothetical protein
MTKTPPMIRARVDGVRGLAAICPTGQQSKMGSQSHQLRQLPIDRSSLAARSRRGYCFIAPVVLAASSYIQRLYG